MLRSSGFDGENVIGIDSRPLMKLARRRGSADGVGGELEVGQPRQQLLEHDLELEPRERLTEAEVRAEPERDVLVRLAFDVEPVRIDEAFLVEVRRLEQQHALLAGRHGLGP